MTRAAVGRRPADQPEGAEDTREKLLLVAERLFGQAGYHAVSLREIASAAGVNMALIGYHFGSKENLFKAAYRMNAEPITGGRRRLIEGLVAEAKQPELAEIIEAWIVPVFRHATGTARHAFIRLSGVLVDEKLPFLDELVLSTHGPVNALFLDALQKCLPALSRETVMCRLSYLIGMLTPAISALPTSIAGVSPRARVTNMQQRQHQMTVFAVAGFLAPEPDGN